MEIPAVVRKAVEDRHLMYLATVDGAGWPNVAPMMQYWWFDDDVIVVGDMFMKKTATNVRETGRVALSMTDPTTDLAYKLKGTATHVESGPEYDYALRRLHEMKPNKSLKGCVVIRVTAAYDVSRGKHAGELIAGEQI